MKESLRLFLDKILLSITSVRESDPPQNMAGLPDELIESVSVIQSACNRVQGGTWPPQSHRTSTDAERL